MTTKRKQERNLGCCKCSVSWQWWWIQEQAVQWHTNIHTHTHAGISVLFLTSAYVSIITSKTFQFKKSEYCHNLNDESRKYFYHVVNFQTRRVATKARCRAWKRPWANCLHAEFSISQLIITEKPLLYKKKGEGRLHSHSIRSSQEEDRC